MLEPREFKAEVGVIVPGGTLWRVLLQDRLSCGEGRQR